MTKNQRGGKGKKSSIKAARPAFKHGSKPIQKPMSVLGQQNTNTDAGKTKKFSKKAKKAYNRDQRNKEFDAQVLSLEERNMGKGRKSKAAKAVVITLQPSLLQETMRLTQEQPTMHYADTLLVGETPASSYPTNITLPSNQQHQQLRPTGALKQNREHHVNKFAVLDDDEDSDEDGGHSNFRKYQLQLQPSLLGDLSSRPAVMSTNEIDDNDL